MSLELTILYRGPLSSCNYRCGYCPFAKRRETARELAADRQALERFVDWVHTRSGDRISILFTPWGEAMTRPWYRNAIAALSHLSHVGRVAIQTNLSWNVAWAKSCDVDRLGLWCTWHPTQTSMEQFVGQCSRLDKLRVSYSVGMVGLKENYLRAIELRKRLPSDVYLWVNAFKDVDGYYAHEEIEQWTELDPLFPVNLRNHASLGKACKTGETVISVDGNGTIRRCHFVPERLGNLYEDPLESLLRPRMCSNTTCDCHIGYIHLESLAMDSIFGDGLLLRAPTDAAHHSLAAQRDAMITTIRLGAPNGHPVDG